MGEHAFPNSSFSAKNCDSKKQFLDLSNNFSPVFQQKSVLPSGTAQPNRPSRRVYLGIANFLLLPSSRVVRKHKQRKPAETLSINKYLASNRVIKMSRCLDSTDPIPEVDSDGYLDEDRMWFIQSLVAVGNSFALVPQSNGHPTYLMYEGLSDDDGLPSKGNNDPNVNAAETKTHAHSANNYPDDGANNGKYVYDLRPRGSQRSSVVKILSDDDGLSGKPNKLVRGLARKQSRGLVNRKWRAARSAHRKGRWAKKRKNNHGKVAEKESIRIIKTRSGQGDGAERATSSCLVEAQGARGNWVVKERRICIMETQGDQGNGVEKEIIAPKLEAPDDQDYGDSNRAYDIWLKNIANICALENGNAETSSDSELEVLDKDPQCSEWKYTPLSVSDVLDTSMKDEDLQYIGEHSKPENPQFRKDVEDILRRPYDEKEYETLWLQMNSRKPVQGYRELRGHLKAYSKDAMGKSYLDEYLDLRIKLDTFETDLPRRLNVLRGFFYYLKNIAHDGIFKPWLDESCLALVPTSQ